MRIPDLIDYFKDVPGMIQAILEVPTVMDSIILLCVYFNSDFDHDAEILSCAAKSPEKFSIFGFRCSNFRAVCKNQSARHDVVAQEAIFPLHSANSAAKGKTND